MLLTLKPSDNNSRYVYIVKNDKNEILYISSDKLTSIVAMTAISPNPQFNINHYYNIEILTAHENYHDALLTSNKLTKELCGERIPPFNISQNYSKFSNVQYIQTGVVYRNANEACKSLGIQAPRMCNHLQKKPGHKTIKGLTFRYYTA